MEALAREGKELVVFDRPNPLGRKIEGCVLSIEAGLIGRLLPGQKYSIPVRYGLTIGEFALYVKPYIPNLNVQIIKMYGYDP
jgi:uncharacterized protein YbbC (DUF1343 family)